MNVDVKEMPDLRVAAVRHIGPRSWPYEKLGDTWARFMGEWLPASGCRVGPGANFEVPIA